MINNGGVGGWGGICLAVPSLLSPLTMTSRRNTVGAPNLCFLLSILATMRCEPWALSRDWLS